MPEVVLRTRRSVMEAAHQIRTDREQRRRQMGFALLAFGVLLVVFTPALWDVVSDLSGGEQVFDMPLMVLTLSLVLLSAMFAILLASWRDGRRSPRDE